MHPAIAQQQQVHPVPLEPEPLESAPPSVVELGEAEIGKPYSGPIVNQPDSYRFGNPGYDCSSFVSEMYRRAYGVTLTPFTDAAYDQCRPLTPVEFRPGDVVFYRYTDASQPRVRYPHMGLWIDDRTTLDCRFGDGLGVGYHAHLVMVAREVRRPRGLTDAPAPTSGGGAVQVLDTTGADIGPMIQRAAAAHALTPLAILSMLIAESGLNPFATREGVWPDVSYGYSQLIVSTAAGYNIGDGSNTPANRAAVKAALFDRETSIDLGAKHLAWCYSYVRGEKGRQPDHDTELLDSLRVYNGGAGALDNPAWEQRWSANVNNYRRAIERARDMLGE